MLVNIMSRRGERYAKVYATDFGWPKVMSGGRKFWVLFFGVSYPWLPCNQQSMDPHLEAEKKSRVFLIINFSVSKPFWKSLWPCLEAEIFEYIFLSCISIKTYTCNPIKYSSHSLVLKIFCIKKLNVWLKIIVREGMQVRYATIFYARYGSGGEQKNVCIPLKTDTHNPINYASCSWVLKIFCLQIWPKPFPMVTRSEAH